MEALKDLLESMSQRLKSPIIGYVITSFILVNWKPFFVLISGEEVQSKFKYFDDNTSFISLVILPFIFGVTVALAAPWISLLGAMWAELPTRKRKILSLRSSYEIAILRNRLSYEQSLKVDSIIKSAKQDVEVKRIDDEEIRSIVEKRIEEMRNSFDKDGDTQRKMSELDYNERQAKNLERQSDLARQVGDTDRANLLLAEATRVLGLSKN